MSTGYKMSEHEFPRGGSQFLFQNKDLDERSQLDSVNGRRTVPMRRRRKTLRKNKIYVDPQHHMKRADDPRDTVYDYKRDLEDSRADRRRSPMFDYSYNNNKRGMRKAMIIGEQPSMYKLSDYRRPELPGNLFVDNLRQQHIDWRMYNAVTWNDILESHVKDVKRQPRDYAQTRPQREAWLASIDDRVRYSKMNSHRGLPSIAPRLFNSKVSPMKPVAEARYLSKDRQGNLFYMVGPEDVTKKENEPFVLPEIVKPNPTKMKTLDF